ncbi:MAG TPA: hypothetical protein VL693_02230 [Vicinamibacterales bacterium]|jgi:hypothetical protein|nr:hypothetical protein [Vicinamibacterales bacterium]
MRYAGVAHVCAVALIAWSCGSNQSPGPAVPSPLPAPVPSPAPTPVPAPAPSPPPAPIGTYLVSGVIRDGGDETSPLSNVTVSVRQDIGGRPQAGPYVPAAVSDARGRYTVAYEVTNPGRVVGFESLFQRSGFNTVLRGVAISGDTTLDVVLPRSCTVTPSRPQAMVSLESIQFSWAAVNGATDYVLDVFASSTPGYTPAIISTGTGGATSYRWNTPPSGRFMAAISSRTPGCGLSSPSQFCAFDTRVVGNSACFLS